MGATLPPPLEEPPLGLDEAVEEPRRLGAGWR